MRKSMAFRGWWPEACLVAAGMFFFLRDLGTFPAAWTDDGIFMTVARTLAEEGIYAIPVLDHHWHFPPFLGSGPPVILPSAFFIRLFGFSVTVARVPMVAYLLLTCLVFYRATREWCGVNSARLGTAALLSLSAFVNNGKPVLGEVPGILFLLMALVWILRNPLTLRGAVFAGAAAGLAILSKITFAPVLGVFGIVLVIRWREGKRQEWQRALLACCIALGVYLPWFLLESMHGSSILHEAVGYLSGNLTSDSVMFNVVRKHPGTLLRIPFLAFMVTLVLGMAGLWKGGAARRPLQWSVTFLVAVYLLYYLDLYGWYRHLLPAHVLLLPFVPDGARRIFGAHFGTASMVMMIALQGWWQLTYRGSSRSTTGAEAAAYILEHFRDTPLLVQQPEVFARLPRNDMWLQLMPEIIAVTFPDDLRNPPPSHRDAPILRKIGDDGVPPCTVIEPVAGSYHLLRRVDP